MTNSWRGGGHLTWSEAWLKHLMRVGMKVMGEYNSQLEGRGGGHLTWKEEWLKHVMWVGREVMT